MKSWMGSLNTFGHIIRHATIEVEDEDLFLSAWYYESKRSMPWIIFVHGIRGCKAGGELLTFRNVIECRIQCNRF